MEISKDYYITEIMTLINKRISLCREWREMLDKNYKNKDISAAEYMRQWLMLKKEMDITGEYMARLERILKM